MLVEGRWPALAPVMPWRKWKSSDRRRGDAWGNEPTPQDEHVYDRSHIGPSFQMGIIYFLTEIN